ncbi:MAG TPA: class I SAM-dependent methyltransferase [Methanomassiliicoccales archaeon]|jgi:tRNA (cmo5U34)-methyltransferase
MDERPLPHAPGDYDAQIIRTIPYYDQIAKETINLVRSLERPPRLWLDTGCGTGTLVNSALNVFPDTHFILVDPSDVMLGQARRKLGGQARVRFLKPSCSQELKCLVTERPDVITAVQCHHYLSREGRKRAVAACYDLLSIGGAYVTFENVRPFTVQGIDIGKRYWERFQLESGKSRTEVTAHLARFDKEYFPITVQEHLELYREIGFEAVEMLWYSYMQAGFYCIK